MFRRIRRLDDRKPLSAHQEEKALQRKSKEENGFRRPTNGDAGAICSPIQKRVHRRFPSLFTIGLLHRSKYKLVPCQLPLRRWQVAYSRLPATCISWQVSL